MPQLIPRFTKSDKKSRPSSPSNSSSRLSVKTDLSESSISTAKPVVSSPDWEIRYDPTLSEYYYINTKTSETQFDHPDEVISPLASPITTSTLESDHRKIFKGCALKRTISPRFFGHGKKSPSQGPTPRTEPEDPNHQNLDVDQDADQDVEEFKKHLVMEMENYEVERLGT
jgi:hypothetical protein